MSWMLHDLLPETADPIVQDYLGIIDNGLPPTQRPLTIAVVGAGMAGLVAASQLAAAGHHVTIYEANTRVGGRVHTLRKPFVDGLYAEAGPMRLPTVHQMVFRYIKKLGLTIQPFHQVDVNPQTGNVANQMWIDVNGVKMRRSEYLACNGAGLGYDLLSNEVGQTAEELLGAVLDPLTTFVNADPERNWPTILERFGKLSMRTYLETQTLYSPGAIEMIEVLLNFESRANLAFVQNLIERALINSENTYFEIQGGMDQLPKAFLPLLVSLGVPVAVNHRLKQITQQDGKVRLGFEPNSRDFVAAGLPAPLSAGFVADAEADAVILTIPFTGLRFVETKPLFSAAKRRAIREMAWDAATKVFLQFSERFWETRDGIYGGYTTTDRPNRFLYYPSHGLGDPGSGILLASYTWAEEARGWDALDADQRVRYALDQVAAIHGEYVRELFVTGTSHSWSQDDFSLGEAAMFQPGQIAELQATVATAEGNVHFAGDHTTLRHAWIEGAIESGLRVAVEVNNAE